MADPIRLRVLALIAGAAELCVCELVAALDLPQPKVSRHLAVLREVGVLADRREAQWVLYSLSNTLDGRSRAIIEAAVAAVCDAPQTREDRERLAGTSRPVRLRTGCRPAGSELNEAS
jgi:ArsR family transcriptional regulator